MNAPDPAWFDAQYDARAANPEHPAIFARWAEASAQARASTPCWTDLRYGNGPLQTADWFVAPQEDGPVLVFLHGGYWRSSDKSLFSFVAPAFVDAGASVVIPNYDLCPAVTLEEIVLQATQALRWLHGELRERGGDAQRVVVSGHSAGGHLAAMLLMCDWKRIDRRLPAQWISRALAISGLYDLEPLRRAPFLARDLRLTPASVERLSPARLPAPRNVVLHAVVGDGESSEFIRQTQRLAEHWGPDAVPVCQFVSQRRHFDILDDLAAPGGRLHALARELLGLPPASATAPSGPET